MVASDTPLRTDHFWLENACALLDAAKICGSVFSAGVAAIYHLGLSFHACKGNCSYAKARTAMTLAFRGDLLFAGDAVAYDSRLAGGTDSADFRIVRRGAGHGWHALDSRLSGKECHERRGHWHRQRPGRAENAAFQLPDAGAKMNIKRSRRKRNAWPGAYA